jgi:hypothetical protein
MGRYTAAIPAGVRVGWLCRAGFVFFAVFKPVAVRRAARKGDVP